MTYEASRECLICKKNHAKESYAKRKNRSNITQSTKI